MTFEEYQAIDAINASAIKVGAASSMLHMRYAMTHKQSNHTPSMRWGSLVHKSVLEPLEFSKLVSVWQGGRRFGKEWDLFNASNDPEWVVNSDEFAGLMAISNAVHAVSLAHKLIETSRHEVTLQWNGSGYGAAKARLDGLTNEGAVVELKTTSKIKDFPNQFVRLGYDIQCGWYAEGVRMTSEKKINRRVWLIVAESVEPYDVAVYSVPVNALNSGLQKAVEIATQYRVCETTDTWPGVQQEQGSQLQMPAWYEGDVEIDDVMPM